MPAWLNALVCVAVPCAIGLTMYGLFEYWDRRRRTSRPGEPLPIIDYTI